MIQVQVAIVVAILGLAAVVSITAQRVLVPWVTQLAVAGAVVGFLLRDRVPAIDPSVILFVFLPGLLFEAAFNLNWRELRQNALAVVLLATFGVVLTTGLSAASAHLFLMVPLSAALLFGAAVAATDPVAVVATFRRLGVPSRLRNLIEAESLLNDGTGVVVFTTVLASLGARSPTAAGIGLDLLVLVGGGVALGALIGVLASRLTGFVDEPQVELTITALAAYGGYLAGDALHVSGILCVVTAGAVIGNYGRARHMSARSRQAAETVWDYVAFVLNSALFVMIGAAVPLRLLVENLPLVAAGAGIVLLARALTVYGLLNLMPGSGRRAPLAWQHLLVWGGLRGAVAVALALSLPPSTPGADSVRALVYGVVLSTIVVQGSTIVPLTRALLPASREGRPAN